MPNAILKNQLITWLKEQDYWLQYAGNCLLEGEVLSDELLTFTFNLFCEEYELGAQTIERTPIVFTELQADQLMAASDLKLQIIKNIVQVNALQTDQTITVGPNLTIVYGGNGAGKTGYIRLLNNAFVARGDKQILPNVYDATVAGEPSCTFTFQSGDGNPYDLGFPCQKERAEFSQYSIFDSYAAKIQLETDNKLNFTPSGFQFFENLIDLFDNLKERLNAAIRLHQQPNQYSQLFVNENNIREAMLALGASSDEEELLRMGTVNEVTTQRKAELTTQIGQLRATDVPKKIRELQALSGQYTPVISQLQSVLDCLTPASIESYIELIESYHAFQQLVSEQGIKQLEGYVIKNLGSNEWKDFIKAAKQYSVSIENTAARTTYPGLDDHCVFCLQLLGDNEKNLISAYWKLLASQAENELAQTIQKIKAALQRLGTLPVVNFTEGQPVFDHAKSQINALAEKWKTLCSEIEIARQNAISNLSNYNFEKPFSGFEVAAAELQPLKNDLDFEANTLMRTNPERKIQELQRELNFIQDKELLSRTINDVLIYVRSQKWAIKAEGCLGAFRTNSITAMQGALFNEHISERFTETFASECRLLNAPTVVEIVQRNVKMSTLRKLQVAGEAANRILSEGEQRSISLADFLTEAQMNPHNKGVIFDDPVNSMDHERKELIAKRLVKLSRSKQVVIFTHDLSFLVRLRLEAENIPDFELTLVSLTRAGNTAGIVLTDTPWIGQTVKTRIGLLKNRLVNIKKTERDGNTLEYTDAVKTWFMYLRETWERVVEERLLKGVVERFGLGIQTQRLQKIEFSAELVSQIEHGMTESSRWVHDTAAGLNPTTPDTAKLREDLDFLEAFANKCKAG